MPHRPARAHGTTTGEGQAIARCGRHPPPGSGGGGGSEAKKQFVYLKWEVGLSLAEGVGGVGKRAQLTGTINQ